MLGIELAPTFHLRVVACSPAILDAITDINVGVDVFANIIRQGLIHLLVGAAVAASATRWTRRASALVRISFVVTPGSSVEVGVASLGSWALGALMSTSSVMVGAMAVS
jgi:hypothetical protein